MAVATIPYQIDSGREARVKEFPGPFVTFSEITVEREVTKRFSGPSEAETQRHGPLQFSDLTLGRDYLPGRDDLLYRRWARGELFRDLTVTLPDLDADKIAIPGSAINLTGCSVKSMKLPGGDANSASPSAFEIVLAVSGVTA